MSKNTYSLTFRGQTVRFTDSRKSSTTSIYDALYFVLSYRYRTDGSVPKVPSIECCFRTANSCQMEIRHREALRQWEGQSFIVKAYPGVTEITADDTEIVEA